MNETLYQVIFIFLAAACLLVPLSQLSGLGAVVGYLLAGILIGPFSLGLIQEPATIMHFSEFGVVMMLFIVGLELRPSKLWEMRGKLLGLGGLQVFVTAGVISGLGLQLGYSFGEAAAVGMTLSLSSTAIAMRIMQERGMLDTSAGTSTFSVLLFQDVIVLGMIASLPLLANYTEFDAITLGDVEHHHSGPHGWKLGLAIVGTLGGMMTGGRIILRPLFRLVAKAGVRETFTALSLLLVFGAALLMEWLSLSPALGTFIAGMVLADCEYRHQLQRDIEPFKALLLGLFFMSVGMSIDFKVLAQKPLQIFGAVLGLISIKAIVLLAVGRLFKLRAASNLLFAALISQAGEFGFVMLQFSRTQGAMSGETVSLLNAVIALSMALTPLVMIAYNKLILPRFNEPAAEGEAPVNKGHKVLVLGFGRVGQVAARLLQGQGIETTLLDHDGDHIQFVKQFGQRVFYGDAADIDLLRTAGAETADVIIIAIDHVEKATQTAAEIRLHFPQAKVIARARNRGHLFDLLAEGVDFAERETVRGALEMGRKALEFLGYSEEEATERADEFLEFDYKLVEKTYQYRGDLPKLIEKTSEAQDLLQKTLAADKQRQEGGELAD